MRQIQGLGRPGESPYKRLSEKATLWGSRDLLGTKLDAWGAKASVFELDTLSAPAPRTYNELFRLQSASDIKLSDLKSPTGYLSKVSGNLEDFRYYSKEALAGRSPFFNGVTARQYARETLWRSNVSPIGETLERLRCPQGRDISTIGSGLARILGLGYLGYDTGRDTLQAYKKAEHNGENPWLSSAGAFAKSAVKNLALWEIAGIGFAFGVKLLPAVGCVPLGGILAGVALAFTADWLLKQVPRKSRSV